MASVGILNKKPVSPSSRRAWIEILNLLGFPRLSSVALLAEGVDRNKFWGNNTCAYPSSPSSRRAWIEIQNRNFFENRA